MPLIKNIINKIVVSGLTLGNGIVSKNFSDVIIKPDICVINQISYLSTVGDVSGLYLIKCDLTHEFIGSFSYTGGSIVSINVYPNTKMFLGNKNNLSSDVGFTIYSIAAGSDKPQPDSSLSGLLSISLDFIEYTH